MTSWFLRGGPAALLALALALATGLGCQSSSGRNRMDMNRAMPITYGTIIGVEQVQLQSAAATGAVVGGLAGLAVRGGGRTTRSMARGAALGGVTTRVLEGSNDAWEYTVRLTSGRDIRVVTDDPTLRRGDCVSVEQGRSTNLREVSIAHCTDPGASEPTESVRGQADACQSAMQSLAEASDEAAIETQLRRVRILCED